ncbi:MAG: hypothetical protein AABY14_03195 [Nanoarchaeota archaeon]
MKQTTKQAEHENCEHAFWVEDLYKEGYVCACTEKKCTCKSVFF